VKIEQIISRYMDKVASNVVDDAKVKVDDATGNLRDSIQSQKINEKSFYVGCDEDTAPYAKYVESGTRFMTPRAFLKRAAYNRDNYKG